VLTPLLSMIVDEAYLFLTWLEVCLDDMTQVRWTQFTKRAY
jgi:hypothetical protein